MSDFGDFKQVSKFRLHIRSALRHRHALGKGCQQADLQLIEPVEMRRFILQLNFDYLLIIKCISVNSHQFWDNFWQFAFNRKSMPNV